VLHLGTKDRFVFQDPAPIELTSSRTDFHVGLQAGADALIVSHRTLGAEVELRYTIPGKTSFTPNPIPPGLQWTFEDGGHDLATRGAFVARWYF
jgi:hypothetical protein